MAKKQVVETVELPETEISLLEARKIDKRFEIGDVVEVDVTPANFGRSAAHTAKQMLIQRLKEAERSVVYEEYYSREGDIITGVITRVEGKNVFINACCHFQDQGGITLGDDCLIGHNVVFATLNHFIEPAERASMHPAPIVLGKKVWVGSNSTILQGVTIGDNSIIAAGSVVTKDVPANTIVGGVPARILRHLDVKEVKG